MSMTLTPAYGRDYKSKAAVLADLKADKDFLFFGKPINRPQLLETGKPFFNARYNSLRKVSVISRSDLEN